MELKQEICITYDEMHRLRRMSREKMEQYLTEVMQAGYRRGCMDSEAGTDEELRQALAENDQKWWEAIRNVLDLKKGLLEKQRKQLLENLKTELERAGICRK